MKKALRLLAGVARDLLAVLPVTPDERARIAAGIDAAEAATGRDLDGDGDVAGVRTDDANGKVGRGEKGRFTSQRTRPRPQVKATIEKGA